MCDSCAASEIVKNQILRHLERSITALKLQSSEGSYHDHGCITFLELLVLNAYSTDHSIVLNKIGNYDNVNGLQIIYLTIIIL